jgi:adhesin HecA-like repeat protein
MAGPLVCAAIRCGARSSAWSAPTPRAGVTLTDFGTLTNTGSLYGSGTLVVDPASLFNSGYIGVTVTLPGGGTLDNEATGTISGNGVYLGAGGTVVNSGSILSPNSFYAVEFGGGGFLTSSLNGYIGSGGVDLSAGGPVVNDGRIVDTNGLGVRIIGAAGTVTNSGTIAGTNSIFGVGIVLVAGGTVIDSDTIIGGATAVYFGGTGVNLLVLEHGYQLSGVVKIHIQRTPFAYYVRDAAAREDARCGVLGRGALGRAGRVPRADRAAPHRPAVH